jgi:hypothetical protein
MAGRYQRAKIGEQVKVKDRLVPFTFWPEAYYKRGRLVTSDPWACLMAHIHQTDICKARENLAIAFLEQAQDFHRAAKAAPRLGSKPLLHYYSFLNLAKVLLTLRTSLDLKRCVHGLYESQSNIRSVLTINSQSVTIPELRGRIQVYREFINECGFPVPNYSSSTKVGDLLEQIVGIHRITNYTLKRPTKYFPISSIRFEYDKYEKMVWLALTIDRADLSDKDAHDIRKHTSSFREVESPNRTHRRYESKPIKYEYSPIKVLRTLVLNTWKDIWSELRPGGYKFWISSINKKNRRAQLASGYQAMFYFGSVARYRPDDFYKLAEGKHGWMVQEFINTQPYQFIYFLGSGIVDAEMVPPELM